MQCSGKLIEPPPLLVRRSKYPFDTMVVGGPAYQEILIGKGPSVARGAMDLAKKWVLKHRHERWRFKTRVDYNEDGNRVITIWRIK